MASLLSWVDYADADRRRMLNVVQLFREKGTVDELGIGSIRDALSNHLFPGTSTIQTRARYMLLVPWVYQRLEEQRIPSSKIAGRSRELEIQLIKSLLVGDDQQPGLIGSEAGQDLHRLPSSVYWNGLKVWGIRAFEGSQSEYHRWLDRYYRRRTRQPTDDDNEPIGTALSSNWHPGLPRAPEGLWESATLSLTEEEAEYLQSQVQYEHPHSLLCELIAPGFKDYEAEFPWHHPGVAGVPAALKQDLVHARNLSETINGVSLLYNLMLAQAQPNDERVAEYQRRFDEWIASIETRRSELTGWFNRLHEFWHLEPIAEHGVARSTRSFVDRWFELMFHASSLGDLMTNPDVAQLIEFRERQLKGNRARLQNRRALELWQGASGDRQLDFRWSVVKQIIADIVTGLPETDA